jgi:tetratricopeptide (TPR) repeat protein
MKAAGRHRKKASVDRVSKSSALWMHGVAAMGDERWEEAIAAFKEFLKGPELTPDALSVTYQNLNVCYVGLERFDEAITMQEAIQRSAPSAPDTFYSAGVTFACAGRFAEAIDHFARQWPQRARQHEVEAMLAKLRRLERGELPAGDYLADHLQEQISHNLDTGDWAIVERKARRIMAANPQRPDGYFALGIACLELNRLAEAYEALRSAQVRDEADYGPTLYNLGYICLQLGKLEEALGWLERSRAAQPDQPSTLLHLGNVCEKLGQREMALTWWRQALALDPSFDPVQHRLHEVGAGLAPVEPPASPQQKQMQTMLPIAKARMRRPHIHTQGSVTLTYDPQVGYLLEDKDNSLNYSLYLGGAFRVAKMTEADLLDLMGIVKLTLRMMNAENTRNVALLVYYAQRPTFSYQLSLDKDRPAESSTHGQFVTTEAPLFFKLRVDSDLDTPYGGRMRGSFIYLRQPPGPGVVVNTLGLETGLRS